MRRLAQSTSVTVMLKLFLSSDHVSAATGKTVAITISKNGGAFGNPNAGATNATEVANGWYKVTLDTTDTGTLGDLVVRGTATSCDDSEQLIQVVSATTGGATNLDAAVSSRSSHTAADVWAAGTRTLTAGTNIVLAKGTGITGFNDLDASGIRAAVGLALANLDTQLGAIAAYIDTEVAAIKAKTDNLPASPAAAGDAMALTAAAVDAILDDVVEGTTTLRQAIRGINAVLLGKASGLGTGTATFRDLADTKDRIVATVDVDGNRSALTRDLT